MSARRVEVNNPTISDSEIASDRAPYIADVNGSPVRIHPSGFIFVGTLHHGNTPVSLSLTIGANGCRCGCSQKGLAFEFVPTPDEARRLAGQLIAMAGDVDKAALTAATDLLARAAHGGAA